MSNPRKNNSALQRVLCVDDEPHFLDAVKRQLRKKYNVTTALGGAAGLRTLSENGPFAVVVSDYMMPEMTGVEFLREAQKIDPDVVTMMLTGHMDLDVAVAALHEGHIFRFINKPCSMEALTNALNHCMEQHRLIVSERQLKADLNRSNQALRELNSWLENTIANRTSTIRRLHQFVRELNGLSSLAEVASVVVNTTAEMLESRRVSLMLPDARNEYLSIVAAVGIPADIKDSVRIPIGTPIAGTVYSEGRSVIINSSDELSPGEGRYDTDLFASLPLISTSLATPTGSVGVLNVTEREDDSPYDDECQANLRAITEAAAIAIHNQIRLQERNEARDAIILALAKLAEHRDPETGAHLERVQHFCRIIAEELASGSTYESQIDGEFIDTIVRSSPLHDIGKVGIPDSILLKPGRLDEAEFEVMKRHSKIGGDTIRALVEQGRSQTFLDMGMEIALYHHEKFDGNGYPSGLKGKEIPLAARIMAIADVYDALTSRRVYKSPMPHEQAALIIRADSGTHFDPEIVRAFEARERDFKLKSLELADNDNSFADITQASSEKQSLAISMTPVIEGV